MKLNKTINNLRNSKDCLFNLKGKEVIVKLTTYNNYFYILNGIIINYFFNEKSGIKEKTFLIKIITITHGIQEWLYCNDGILNCRYFKEEEILKVYGI